MTCDDHGNPICTDEVEYLLTPDSGFDDMVRAAVSRLGHSRFAPIRESTDPWSTHKQSVADRIESRRFLLRKMKCQNGGFSPRVAIALVRSFVISIATYGAVIWNNASCVPDPIEDKLTEIYADILGCQRNTPSVLVRAELGCKSQRCERDLCSLTSVSTSTACPA